MAELDLTQLRDDVALLTSYPEDAKLAASVAKRMAPWLDEIDRLTRKLAAADEAIALVLPWLDDLAQQGCDLLDDRAIARRSHAALSAALALSEEPTP